MEVLEDVTFIEGDEEVQYVVIDLPPDAAMLLTPGAPLSIQDLDSDQPKLQLPNGTVLKGAFEDNLGSIILFEPVQQGEQGQSGGEPMDAEGAGADGSGQPGVVPGRDAAPPRIGPQPLKYKCHTEKLLVFS